MPSHGAIDADGEERPLLSDFGERAAETPSSQDGLPKVQVATVLLSYFVESVIALFAFPFLGSLVRNVLEDPTILRVAYHFGILESSGHLTTAIAVIFWGNLSDSRGRKPVLLTCSAGLAVAIICFGLSKTFAALLMSRIMDSMFRAKPIVKSALADLSNNDEPKMAQAFSLVPAIFALASTVAPLIGGSLSQPYDRFPLFRHRFWADYPYLLPCLVVSACCIATFITMSIVLKETCPPKQHNANSEAIPQADGLPKFFPPSRRLVIVLANYAVQVFLDVSFSSARAFFLSTPIALGGLGLNPHTIGIILGTAGPVHGLAQAILFKHAHKRWDLRTIYAVCMAAYVPVYLSLPIMNVLARQAGHVTPLVWTLIVLMELSCTFSYTAFSCAYVYITQAAPSRAAIGRTHGAAQTVYSLVGGIGPFSVTALMGASVEYNLVGGTLAYLVMAAVSIVGVALAFLLPKSERRR